MANNITVVRLCSVPLEDDYLHTLYFGDKTAQSNYFATTVKHQAVDCTYQRKDNIIRFPEQFDSLLDCNYVMYQNPAYNNKWFYAFIDKMEYVNDGLTNIHIKTDVIQTWLFDYTVKHSYVEREHVNDDTIGLHTVPEQLETGDYIVNYKNKNASLCVHSLIMGVTVDINNIDGDDTPDVAGDYYNGIYSGVKYYKLTASECNAVIKALAKAGKSDAIQSIFVCPSLFVSTTAIDEDDSPLKYPMVEAGQNVVKKGWINTVGLDDNENYKPTAINGYIPKNNKLFTYPYCYMLMSNNNGGSAIYKYELFNNKDNENLCPFNIYGSITPGMSIFLTPCNYNGIAENVNEGLTLGKYPICNWTTDVYTNWLTQNAVNIPLQVLTSAGTIAGGVGLIATGGGAMAGAGAIAGGVTGIIGTCGEVYAHSLQPPQMEGNINCGDVMFSSANTTFTAYQMTIKREYAEIIDGFFNMFGYKVNSVKVPLKNHRKNYWYTKTIDVNIDGAIPMGDMKQIKACYNNGITFWKNASNIQNYSVDNAIV